MEESFPNQNPEPQPAVEAEIKKSLKPRVLLGGIFLIIILTVLAFGLWWYKFNNDDDLIGFVPIDAILYAQAQESFWPNNVIKITNLPFSNFFEKINNEILVGIDFKENLLANSSQAAVALLEDENNNLQSVFFFKIKNQVPLEVLNNIPSLVIGKNILVLSNEPKLIEKVKEVSLGSTFSLAGQIDLKKLTPGVVRVYVSSNNLNNYLNQNQELINKIFTSVINQDIYLSIDNKKSQWKIKIQGLGNFSNVLSQPLLENLPADFGFYISGINLAEIFSSWSALDEKYLDFYSRTSESFKAVHNFELPKAIELLSKPAELIIFDQDEESAWGFNFVLVMDKPVDEQLDNFKDLIRTILAQKLPAEKETLLPDGSVATELLAQPENWQWQEAAGGIFYLKEEALDFEISYLADGSKILFSNSTAVLENFNPKQGININNLVDACQLHQRFLIISAKNIFQNFTDYLPEGFILISEGDNGSAYGCISQF